MTIPGPFGWTNSIMLSPFPFSAPQMTRLRSAVSMVDSLGVALVDVSKGAPMAFALNFTKTAFAASLPKIAAMYATYYLQDRLRTAMPLLAGMSLEKIEATLKKEWRPALKAKLPRSTGDFPLISKIFKSTDFKLSETHKNDLIKMIQASKNSAAGRVIHRIGYDYLNAVLIHGGLYSVGDVSGLWLAGDYIKATDPTNRDGLRPKGLSTTQAASAKSTALLLVNLAREELISSAASKKMLILMNDASSWVRDKIKSIHPEAAVFGKVGYAGGTNHDCAIVKHNDAHYVVVTLFSRQDLDPLFVELDVIAQELFMFRKAAEFLKSMVFP